MSARLTTRAISPAGPGVSAMTRTWERKRSSSASRERVSSRSAAHSCGPRPAATRSSSVTSVHSRTSWSQATPAADRGTLATTRRTWRTYGCPLGSTCPRWARSAMARARLLERPGGSRWSRSSGRWPARTPEGPSGAGTFDRSAEGDVAEGGRLDVGEVLIRLLAGSATGSGSWGTESFSSQCPSPGTAQADAEAAGADCHRCNPGVADRPRASGSADQQAPGKLPPVTRLATTRSRAPPVRRWAAPPRAPGGSGPVAEIAAREPGPLSATATSCSSSPWNVERTASDLLRGLVELTLEVVGVGVDLLLDLLDRMQLGLLDLVGHLVVADDDERPSRRRRGPRRAPSRRSATFRATGAR